MRTFNKFLVLLAIILNVNVAMANEDITGTWQGELVPAPGAEVTIQFVISQETDGAFTVVLTSPDEGGIKDIKATEVLYDAGNLKLDVTELSGSYEGIIKDGHIEGEWMQEGTTMPLNLSPYQKPTLSKEDKEKLIGEWHGDLTIPIGTLTLVLRFEMAENGDLAGYLDVPDQNATGIPVTDMEGSDGKVTLKISSMFAEINGELIENEIIGEFKQGPDPLPLTLKKGKYVPPMNEFKLSKKDQEMLMGEWHGQLNTPATPVMPAGSITIVVRFVTTEDGQFKGYLDSPDQGSYDTPITSLEVDGVGILFKVQGLFLEFSGTFSGDTMVGEHKQGPSTLPLTLAKGKYVPPIHSLNLPKEAIEKLTGTWTGQFGPMTMAFRFETSDTGDFVAFLDIPNQKAKGIPVTDATFSDGELSFNVKGIYSEFKGKFLENELDGSWTQAGNTTPLTLTKE